MLTTFQLIGLLAFVAAVLGAGFLIQRLDAAISGPAEGTDEVPAARPPAPSKGAGRHRR